MDLVGGTPWRRRAGRTLVAAIGVLVVAAGLALVPGYATAGPTNMVPNGNLELDSDGDGRSDCVQRAERGAIAADFAREYDPLTQQWHERVTVEGRESGNARIFTLRGASGCAPAVDPTEPLVLTVYYRADVAFTPVAHVQDVDGNWRRWERGPLLPAASERAISKWELPALPADARRISVGFVVREPGTVRLDAFALRRVHPERPALADDVDVTAQRIALLVGNEFSPSSVEHSIASLLGSLGHSVTFVTHSTYVDRSDGYDLAVLSPEDGTAFFNTEYHPDRWGHLPMLDLAFNPYRRWMSRWADDQVPDGRGRFDFSYFEQQDLWLFADPLGWGREPGRVAISDGTLVQNLTLRRGAITAQPHDVFLGYPDASGSTSRDDLVAGFFVPAGATIYQPNAYPWLVVGHTSTAPYIHLNLYRLSTHTWTSLDADGSALVEAAIGRLTAD